MKYIALLICFISSVGFAQTGKVPSEWLSSDSSSHLKSLKAESEQLNELDQAYNNILDAKMNLFEAIPDDSHKKWQLQSIKTEFAFEASGNIGVMGVGGEVGMDLVWIKKGTNGSRSKMLRPSLAEVTEPEAESVQISAEMSDEAINKEISPLVDLAMATGHVKHRKKLLKNLFTRALDFQKTVKELEASPALGPWYAYKYQLELFVSAEGTVSLFAIGNSIRLRMEWWRLQKTTPAPLVIPELPGKLSHNAQFVASIAADLGVLDQVPFDNGFRLNAIKIGVGSTAEGDLLLVKSKAKAVGAIFLKRDEMAPASFLGQDLGTTLNSYKFKEGNETIQIPRFQFANGLKKSAKISHFFASRAKTRENSKFELNVIEMEFELYRTGGIGLVSVEGSSTISLFITRNVNI